MLSEFEEKRLDFGSKVKVFIQLYLENPREFNQNRVFDLILDEYEKKNFDLEDEE